jgi:hypothetical protein
MKREQINKREQGYIVTEKQRKMWDGLWTLEYDTKLKTYCIDDAYFTFWEQTDDCIWDEPSDIIILGVFNTRKECEEYMESVKKIKEAYEDKNKSR